MKCQFGERLAGPYWKNAEIALACMALKLKNWNIYIPWNSGLNPKLRNGSSLLPFII